MTESVGKRSIANTAPDVLGEEHRVDDETVIWRYVAIERFLDVLFGHIALTRADVQDDRAEGAVGWPRLTISDEAWRRLGGEHGDARDFIERCRRRSYLSSWHERSHESESMWYHYGGHGTKVAFVTTVGKLRKILPGVAHGRVSYCDRVTEAIHTPEQLFFFKRRPFADEREVRFVLLNEREDHDLSKEFPCDADAFLDELYFAPDVSAHTANTYLRVADAIYHQQGRRFRIPARRSALSADAFDDEDLALTIH
jgi:hypothetical protein